MYCDFNYLAQIIFHQYSRDFLAITTIMFSVIHTYCQKEYLLISDK